MAEEVKRKRGRPRKEESEKSKTSAKSLKEVVKEKSERMMEGVAYWASFYRKNPQRFAKEYLNINLKLFQKILLYVMMWATNFIYIAARG